MIGSAIVLTSCGSHNLQQAGQDATLAGQEPSSVSIRMGEQVAMTHTEAAKSGIGLYCNAGGGRWHRVLTQSDAGVLVDKRRLDFDTVWKSSPRKSS